MAELTWLGSGELTDPSTGKTFKRGEAVSVSKADYDRLSQEFPGRFAETSEAPQKDEVELHSPLDIAEAEAEGTLIEDDKGKKGGK